MSYLGNTTLSISIDNYLGNARETLANNSLVGDVLLANNITTRELSNDAVSSNNIINNAVTEEKIADNAVGSRQLVAGAVIEKAIPAALIFGS